MRRKTNERTLKGLVQIIKIDKDTGSEKVIVPCMPRKDAIRYVAICNRPPDDGWFAVFRPVRVPDLAR